MKYFAMLAAMIVLTGCASEVDKCVNAEMKAWRVERDNAIKHNELHKNEIEEAEAHNKKLNEEIAKAQIGKNDYNENSKATYIDEKYLAPISTVGFKNVNRRAVDTTPEEVVEADKRRMCIQLLK